ncbi:MAG: hypothetical protein JXD23_10380 [Spirochaetales bacterium]|nr:hypothetical protein [Spirochaetales bacterium]
MSSMPFDDYDPKLDNGISGILTSENDTLDFSIRKEDLAITTLPVTTEEVRIGLDKIVEVRAKSSLGKHFLTIIPMRADLFKNFGDTVENELVLYVKPKNK